MNLPDFKYERPQNLDAALELLRGNPQARVLAGGQTLIPALKQRLDRPSVLIDLRAIAELRGIEVSSTHVSVGAMTRHAEIAAHADIGMAIPALRHLASGIAHPQVRNMGTIGGSIANNDPAADYPAAVVGLDATVETTKRRIPADAFFTGLFETALEPEELVLRVHFRVPRRAGYHKIANQASGYVTVGCFIAAFDGQIRVAVNGAGPCVFRQADFEAALRANWSPDAIRDLKQDPATMNEDMHASKRYRAHLVAVAAARALNMAAGGLEMEKA
ncbi:MULTISPECIES: FAD binding domain-containing protein [Nitratireductor]|uniref:FAD binding domain-containing protein n=1 Tax=Nitratireductor TaxID=245876 RepID=UPI000D0D5346|nr:MULTISPECIES: xanthine dehydrogenase family protein subunit M [Nitratireductor]PSM16409.1 carbon monoxide dehydrogenase [Nitratireductor sp. StC3]